MLNILDVIGYVLGVDDPEKVPNSTSIKRRVTIIDEFDREVTFNFRCFLCLSTFKYFLLFYVYVTFYNQMGDVFNSKLDVDNGSVVAFGGLGVTSFDGDNVSFLDAYDDTILEVCENLLITFRL